MDNQETMVTLGTQDIRRMQTKQTQHNTIQKTKKMSNTDPTETPPPKKKQKKQPNNNNKKAIAN
jgi:hypothetical protein